MLNVVDTALVNEENWSSISSGIFQGKKKVACMKSEMQILRFYFVEQRYLQGFLSDTDRHILWILEVKHPIGAQF